MKLNELIEKYKRYEGKWNSKTGELARQIFLEDLKQLDEPEKVKIPQFVADWIKYCKRTGVNLYNALDMGDLYFYNYANQKDDLKLKEFFETDTNQDLFARAWLDGYEVDERYRVKFKGFNSSYIILKHHHYDNTWFLGGKQEYEFYRTKHTRKQLEEANFGWVFDCPGVEVTEVE